ncbi:hypothetical protein [Pseudomonas sp. NPDC089534]|uniref:hypothetical protein n=1 Tax=Pseudomonas sp. NPDC089534 TaxID=3364468 RepID=UPI00382EC31F
MNAAIRFFLTPWDGLSDVRADGLQGPDPSFAAARTSRGGHVQSRPKATLIQ